MASGCDGGDGDGDAWPDGLAPLVRWLQQPAVASRALDCAPMPLKASSKAPLFPHKDPAAWLLAKACDFAARNRGHAAWGLLLDGLLVVDADDAAAVAWLEGLAAAGAVAELRDCPVQLTRKGRHYLFARPAWADAEGYWDGARQAVAVDATTGQPYNVDLKTRCATGTRGVLSVAPSPHKSWLAGRAPWEAGVVLHDAPRALLALVATPKGGKARPGAASSALVVATPSRTPPGPSSNSVVVAAVAAPRREFSELEVAQAEMDVFKACDLAASLSPSRAHDERTWMEVGWALHNVAANATPAVPGADAGLLAAWDAFSKTSAKYKSGECAERWAKMDVRDATQARLTLGSLVRWAREDAGVSSRSVSIPSVALPSAPPEPQHRGALLADQRLSAPDDADAASVSSPFLSFSATRDASSVADDRPSGGSFTQIVGRLRSVMLDYVKSRRWRKLGERFWVPVPGCPCAYVEGAEFANVINDILVDDPDFNMTNRHKELVEYFKRFNPRECRCVERDRNLLSFANGVLLLREARFVSIDGNGDVLLPPELEGKIARHHIPRDYTGSMETPSMDRILLAQMPPDVADTLWVLLGRTLFRVRELDNWQVAPFLVGAGGTGKSLVLSAASAMFARSAVGTINNTHEQVFGLESKVDCELVVGRDLPKKMSAVLPQELLQLMITGEPMSVPRKGQTALDVEWSAPLVFASNFVPDYDNSAGQIARRLAVFRFSKPIAQAEQDPTHEARVQGAELPAIVARALHAYIDAVERHGTASFWSWCPDALKRSQQFLTASMSSLRYFLSLTADDEDRERLVQAPGWFVSYKLLQAAFARFVEAASVDGLESRPERFSEDGVVASGFVVERNVNCCNACGHYAPRPARCCDAFHADRRSKLKAVAGVRLVRV